MDCKDLRDFLAHMLDIGDTADIVDSVVEGIVEMVVVVLAADRGKLVHCRRMVFADSVSQIHNSD